MKLKSTMGKLSFWPCLLQMSKNEASQSVAIFWKYPWNSIRKWRYVQVWLKRQLRHNTIELKWYFKQARKWESIQIKRQSHYRNRSLQALRIWSEKVEQRKFCLWKCFSSQIKFGRLHGERRLFQSRTFSRTTHWPKYIFSFDFFSSSVVQARWNVGCRQTNQKAIILKSTLRRNRLSVGHSPHEKQGRNSVGRKH